MKIFLSIIISVVSGMCHSQQWFFRLKPMFGTPIASFQRNDKVVYDSNINFSNGFKPSNISIMDNVLLHLKYNMELFADFYQLNPKWQLGVGYGIFQGASSFLKINDIEQNSKLLTEDAIFMGNSQTSRYISLGSVMFTFYSLATRKIQAEINGKKNVHQFVSFGVGITKNQKNDISFDLPPHGLWISETYKSQNYFPFLMLRYELEFLSKKGKNLFNCSITYQQGIYKMKKFTQIDIYNQGSFTYQQSVTRGSNISVNIIKPFYLKRPKIKAAL